MDNYINFLATSSNDSGRLFSEKVSGVIILTFEIDLILLEKLLLRKFQEKGAENIIIFVDKNRFLEASNRQCDFIRRANFLCIPLELGNIFHPKAILVTENKNSRFFLGSGNLTYNGLSYNKELYFEFRSENEKHKSIFKDFLFYLENLLLSQNITDNFIQNKIDKILNVDSLVDISDVDKNDNIIFLHNIEKPILEQLKAIETNISSIHAFAPFVDKNLKTLYWIKKNINNNLDFYFQKDYTNFNPNTIYKDINLYEYPSEDSRNLHAKCIIFEKDNSIDILFGSPNITESALLKTAIKGNYEISVLFKEIEKENKQYYLPSKKVPINYDEIKPISFENNISTNFIIESARYSIDETLLIKLKQELNLDDQVDLFINNSFKTKINLETECNKEKNIINKTIPSSSDQIPVYLFLIINNLQTNKILVLNELENIKIYNKNESRILNNIKPFFNNEALNKIIMINELDGYTSITQQTIVQHTQKEKFYNGESSLEKIDEETEQEIEASLYYVNQSDLELSTSLIDNNKFNFYEGFFYIFFSDIFNLLNRYQQKKKKANDLDDTDKKDISSKEKEELPDLIIMENLKKRISKKIENQIFQISIFEPKTEDDFLIMSRAYNRSIPLFNLISRGLELKLPGINKTLCLSWYPEDEKQFYEFILKTIDNYLGQLLNFYPKIKNRLPKSLYMITLPFSLFTLIYLSSILLSKFNKDPDYLLNKAHYEFIVKKILEAVSKCFMKLPILFSFEEYKESREYQILTELTIDNSGLRNKFLEYLKKSLDY